MNVQKIADQRVYNALESLKELKELRKKQAVVMDELEKALTYRMVWNECFDKGKLSCYLSGDYKNAKKVKLVMERSDGARMEVPFLEVPELVLQDLYPSMDVWDRDHLRKQYQKHQESMNAKTDGSDQATQV